MAVKRNFEEQVAALDALRQLAEEARVEPLRKALAGKNNFVVAKAADMVREFLLAQLTPELLGAFDRFFEHSEKTDPQCWAKNAITRALAALEHQDSDVFLRGMRHIQMEPVWGGRSDTAGTLRATCALALVQCRSLSEADLLRHLVELLGDKDKAVRAEVVRAIEQIGSTSSSLLLRLRAVLGSDEPEVLGACYSGILSIESVAAIPWISRFLAAGDDAAAEASLAIAGTHSPEGFNALRRCLETAADSWFRAVLLSAIALTRQDAALEFLLELVRVESLDAEDAIEAVLRSLPSPEAIERLEKLVAGNPRLKRTFVAHRK
jgi:HEAT repeat protein